MRKYENEFFSNIKDLRKLIGLTQKELAALLGVSQAYTSQIEKYQKPFNTELAKKLANELSNIVGSVFHAEMNSNQNFCPNWELLYLITPYDIEVGHTASEFPLELQKQLYDRIVEGRKISLEVEYILKYGKEPSWEEIAEYDIPPYDCGDCTKTVLKEMLKLESSKEILSKLKSDLQKESIVSNFKSGMR